MNTQIYSTHEAVLNHLKRTAMKKQNKYTYLKVIQQNYGNGWEDNSQYECNSQFQNFEKSGVLYTDSKGRTKERSLIAHDLEEYNRTGYATRLICRKELNTNTIQS